MNTITVGALIGAVYMVFALAVGIAAGKMLKAQRLLKRR